MARVQLIGLNLPNFLTVLRIIAIPVVVICYYLPISWSHELSAAVFVLACITDWLDGYLARRLDQSTKLGAFLDPVADKLLVASALVVLVADYATPWMAIPAAVIIGREIVVSALREWMAEFGQRGKVAVSYLGKVKTGAQMVAIVLLLASSPATMGVWVYLGYAGLYIATCLTLLSMYQYLVVAWPLLNNNKNA